jgi:succinate-acetate transporter protein
VTVVVIGLLLLMLVISGIGKVGGHVALVHAGGYVGLVVAFGAAYIACAELLEAVYGRSILPLKPL